MSDVRNRRDVEANGTCAMARVHDIKRMFWRKDGYQCEQCGQRWTRNWTKMETESLDERSEQTQP